METNKWKISIDSMFSLKKYFQHQIELDICQEINTHSQYCCSFQSQQIQIKQKHVYYSDWGWLLCRCINYLLQLLVFVALFMNGLAILLSFPPLDFFFQLSNDAQNEAYFKSHPLKAWQLSKAVLKKTWLINFLQKWGKKTTHLNS